MPGSSVPADLVRLARLARLQAELLETASVAAITDRSRLVDAIARTVAEAAGWGIVAVNLYRPAWDDMVVETVYGPPAARDALLGESTAWDTWAPLLAGRFEHRGAYLVPHEQFDWASLEGASYASERSRPPEPDAWDRDDALFVLLAAEDGSVAGVISVDDPVTGLRPTDDEVDVLVAIAAHAGATLRYAGETAHLRAHRAVLTHFYEVFSRRFSASVQELVDAVVAGVRETLGFHSVWVELLGATAPDAPDAPDAPVAQLLSVASPRYGCFLLTAQQAAELAPRADLGPTSVRSGTGPRAWRDHRLLVGLWATTGELLGVLHVGDPHDRQLPEARTLQALRVIGDQTAAQLESAVRLRELRYLADHDPLTGLGNRRAFMDTLEAETARARRYESRFTLAVCDVDDFKLINDRLGHADGDDALRRIARVMSAGLRRSDGAYRIGGDEFALILVETTPDATREVIDRIEEVLRTPESAEGPAIQISVGAVGSRGEDDAETLLRRADEALYAVKGTRRSA